MFSTVRSFAASPPPRGTLKLAGVSGETACVYWFEVAFAGVLVAVALVTALASRIGIPNSRTGANG